MSSVLPGAESPPRGDKFEGRFSGMNKCAYCGGPLGLMPYRKLKLRFCRLACKKAYEHRRKDQVRRQFAFQGALARGGT